MVHGGINYLAILVATVAAFVIGSVYYSALSKVWMKAARIQEAKFTPFLLINAVVCELVMAFILAGVVYHLSGGDITLYGGIVSAVLIWLGFVVTTQAVNHRYQDYGWDLTIIDSGHWLLVLLAMGAIIGWFGA